MSKFEREIKDVISIEIGSEGFKVMWIDKKRSIKELTEPDIFKKDFEIISLQRGENAGLITFKIEN